MLKVFIIFLSLVLGMINASFAVEKSVNSVVEETVNDDTPRESKVKSSEDLASEFLKKHGLTKGDNGDIFIAVGTAYLKTKRPKRRSMKIPAKNISSLNSEGSESSATSSTCLKTPYANRSTNPQCISLAILLYRV